MPDRRLTRSTITFIPRGAAALAEAMERTGDNVTDSVNRAVQVYAHLLKLADEGQLVFVENPSTGERERLILL